MTALLDLINGYKTYAAAILMIVTGLGSILSKHYSEGLAEILQALTLISAGGTAMALRQAIAKVPEATLSAAGPSAEMKKPLPLR